MPHAGNHGVWKRSSDQHALDAVAIHHAEFATVELLRIAQVSDLDRLKDKGNYHGDQDESSDLITSLLAALENGDTGEELFFVHGVIVTQGDGLETKTREWD